MTDERLRALARAARGGDPAARAAHVGELLRAGRTTGARVALAADLGDPAAREVLGQRGEADEPDGPRARQAHAHRRAELLAERGGDLACREAARFALGALLGRRLSAPELASDRTPELLAARRALLGALGGRALHEAEVEIALDRVWEVARSGVYHHPWTAQLRALVATFDARRAPRRNGRAAAGLVLSELSPFERPAFHAAFTPWLVDPANALDAGLPPTRLLVVTRAGQVAALAASIVEPPLDTAFRAAGGCHQVEVRRPGGARRLLATSVRADRSPGYSLIIRLPPAEVPVGAEVWEVGP